MTRIDLNNDLLNQEIENSKAIEIYRAGKFIGKYILEKTEAITEIEVGKVINSENEYFVPAYQRGYRWTKKQVKDLLNDIWNWQENARYSLQPIVVNQLDDGRIELVDGQQRLTTIYIILKASMLFEDNIKYQIEYETRKGTAEFLKFYLDNESKSSENIDWFYMHQCYMTAKSYFEIHDSKKWIDKLLDGEKGAFFIQYQILKEIDSRKVEQIFTGLNAGKIPLTNSELVKALILRENNFKNETYHNEFVEIAQEWDRIEKRLQEPNFWAWLGQDLSNNSPHIDFILDAVADLIKQEKNYSLEKKVFQELYSYNVINKYFREGNNIGIVSTFWKKVKQCFMTFEDWYSDNEIYHLVGYLLNAQKVDIKSLYQQYLEHDFFDFKTLIKKINFDELSLESIDLRRGLLLFNIVTCINTKSKFRFDDYVEGNYDVEHISPHSGFDKIQKSKERVEWINSIRDANLSIFSSLSFEDVGVIVKDDKKFIDFYNSVIILTESKTWNMDNINRLGNLCLLDSETNRGYGNKPFPLKVKEIVKVDMKQSRYLLPATKNVFLKYYSDLNVNNLTWDESDAESYEKIIKDTLFDYFGWEDKEDEK